MRVVCAVGTVMSCKEAVVNDVEGEERECLCSSMSVLHVLSRECGTRFGIGRCSVEDSDHAADRGPSRILARHWMTGTARRCLFP